MWKGISYGTVLGATLGALYPHRIDKMVLDGVVNVHEYYQNRYYTSLWPQTCDSD